MTPDVVEPSNAEIAWRLRALETSVGKLESHVSEGFGAIATQINALNFVPRGEYSIELKSIEKSVGTVLAVAEGARTLAMWAIGLIASVSIGAIVTGLLIKASG